MHTGVHRQVQFQPYATLFLTVFVHLPFALIENLQACGVDSPACNFAARGVLLKRSDRLGRPADARKIRAT